MNDMTDNKLIQANINQPRVIDDYDSHELKKAGILNVTVDDLPNRMPLELRKNIVIYSNELYHLGTVNNVEYATALDAKTGKILDGNGEFRLFTDNDIGKVHITEGVLANRKANSVSIIHNHTNRTVPSDDDVAMLVSNQAVRELYLASEGRLLRIAKAKKVSYNIGIDSVDGAIERLVWKKKSIEYYLANSSDRNFAEIKKLFVGYGILLERW